MKFRKNKCMACPWRKNRRGPALDAGTKATANERIEAGEQWVCHETCDGARVTVRSKLCAGAPKAGTKGALA